MANIFRKFILMLVFICVAMASLNPQITPLYAQGSTVTDSMGDPEDAYLEFTLTGADLKLRDGTTNHYSGPWTGGPITLSGKFVVTRKSDLNAGGAVSYVRFYGYLVDQRNMFKWPEDEVMRLVQNRTETQEKSITYTVPDGYNQPTVEGKIEVEVCGQVCGKKEFFFHIDMTTTEEKNPVPEATPPVVEEKVPESEEKPPCKEGTPKEKLEKILQIYREKIPNGITKSGPQNNMLFEIDTKVKGIPINESKYDKYRCGGYQSMILDLLSKLKFSDDPCEIKLLDDYDFGPIQAAWGGHQAVVIYPKGTDWKETGIVLDPWLEQKPKTYSIQDWKTIMQASSSRLIAGGAGLVGTAFEYFTDYIGPSETYNSKEAGNYPMYGGKYQPFGDLNLPPEMEKFSKEQLSASEKEYVKNLDLTERQKYIQMKMSGSDKSRKIIAHCPIVLSILSPDGSRTGMIGDQFFYDLTDVSYLQLTLSDGTYYTEIEFPENPSYTLVVEGIGNGPANVLVGDGLTSGPIYPLQHYAFTAETDKIYQIALEQFDSPMISVDSIVQPITLLPNDDTTWIENLPDLLIESGDTPESNILQFIPNFLKNPPTALVIMLLIMGLLGLGLFVIIFIVRIAKKKKPSDGLEVQKSPSALPIVLMIGLIIFSCLMLTGGGVGLFLKLRQPDAVGQVSEIDQTLTALARTESYLAQRQTVNSQNQFVADTPEPTLPHEPSLTPAPTNTVAVFVEDTPTATNQPASTVPQLTGGQFIRENAFFDDFSSNAMGWPIKDDGLTYLDIVNQAYFFQVSEKNGFENAYFPIDFFPNDIIFDVWGPENASEGTFGVICNLQDANNYYYVDFDLAGGNYSIVQVLNGSLITLVEETYEDQYWHSTDAFNQPATSKNRIKVSCYLGDIAVVVNETLVDLIFIDQPFTKPGWAAFFVYTYTNVRDTGFQVIIDNVEAYRPVQ